MNLDEWTNEVVNHNQIMATVFNDRKILKNSMEEFLKSYFDFQDIEFSSDLKVITLSFKYEATILNESIGDFPLDYKIDFYRSAIEVYPFGVD